jgi:hypothetical protein
MPVDRSPVVHGAGRNVHHLLVRTRRSSLNASAHLVSPDHRRPTSSYTFALQTSQSDLRCVSLVEPGLLARVRRHSAPVLRRVRGPVALLHGRGPALPWPVARRWREACRHPEVVSIPAVPTSDHRLRENHRRVTTAPAMWRRSTGAGWERGGMHDRHPRSPACCVRWCKVSGHSKLRARSDARE